jgi:hypothetical protein
MEMSTTPQSAHGCATLIQRDLGSIPGGESSNTGLSDFFPLGMGYIPNNRDVTPRNSTTFNCYVNLLQHSDQPDLPQSNQNVGPVSVSCVCVGVCLHPW